MHFCTQLNQQLNRLGPITPLLAAETKSNGQAMSGGGQGSMYGSPAIHPPMPGPHLHLMMPGFGRFAYPMPGFMYPMGWGSGPAGMGPGPMSREDFEDRQAELIKQRKAGREPGDRRGGSAKESTPRGDRQDSG